MHTMGEPQIEQCGMPFGREKNVVRLDVGVLRSAAALGSVVVVFVPVNSQNEELNHRS